MCRRKKFTIALLIISIDNEVLTTIELPNDLTKNLFATLRYNLKKARIKNRKKKILEYFLFYENHR